MPAHAQFNFQVPNEKYRATTFRSTSMTFIQLVSNCYT
jgi:hypothetical protein